MSQNAVELAAPVGERRVIFQGTPSQVVNLPVLIGSVAALVAIAVAYSYVAPRVHVPGEVSGLVAIVPALFFVLRAVAACLQTAFTEIIIDTERITCRQGIFNKEVSSLELFRIQDVTSFHPWWERLFGIGTIVVATSDSYNPRWRLPGMADAEALRADLNRAAIALRDHKGIREVNMGRV